MEPLLEGLLRSLGGSEANFLEVCFGRTLYGNVHIKATSGKSRPPSDNVRSSEKSPPASPVRRLAGRLSYNSAESPSLGRSRGLQGKRVVNKPF